ncbi:M24 family metallopeptidase [Nakamurella lactea]|uniref:M24 family metallopeptidase n=1 Tax=Nakamurella lactea TaxID=459515 RepID=UPI00041A5943|nr:M24 family metallopeptidase [Nakamurella lactea]
MSSVDLFLPEPAIQPSIDTRLPLEFNRQRSEELLAEVAGLGGRAVLLTDPWNIVHYTGLWAATTERPLYALLTVGGSAPFWFYPTLDRELVTSWWFADGAEYFDYPHVAGQFPSRGTAEPGPALDLWDWALSICAGRGLTAPGSLMLDRNVEGADRITAQRALGYAPQSLRDRCLRSRVHKRPEELALIRRAYGYFERVHAFARDFLLTDYRPGLTDYDLRTAMTEHALSLIVPDLGLDGEPHRGVGVAVDLGWVRAGRVTGYPHPNQFRYSKIEPGGPLQVSGVIRLGGYGGECYRPYVISPRTSRRERLWTVVRDSCLLQREQLQAGRTCGEVAAVIHRFQIDAGMQGHLYHRPAHGQGPEGHQPPWLALGDGTVLEPGMCFSVEPGLYDPVDGFSANFSDTFVVQESGPALQMSRVPWTTEWGWITV